MSLLPRDRSRQERRRYSSAETSTESRWGGRLPDVCHERTQSPEPKWTPAPGRGAIGAEARRGVGGGADRTGYLGRCGLVRPAGSKSRDKSRLRKAERALDPVRELRGILAAHGLAPGPQRGMLSAHVTALESARATLFDRLTAMGPAYSSTRGQLPTAHRLSVGNVRDLTAGDLDETIAEVQFLVSALTRGRTQ